MFAVTGITGKVGAAVARSLLSADQPVRAIVRDRSRSAPWAQLGCDIAVADLSDTEALTAAFAGTAGVFAMLPPVFDPARCVGKPISIRAEHVNLSEDSAGALGSDRCCSWGAHGVRQRRSTPQKSRQAGGYRKHQSGPTHQTQGGQQPTELFAQQGHDHAAQELPHCKGRLPHASAAAANRIRESARRPHQHGR